MEYAGATLRSVSASLRDPNAPRRGAILLSAASTISFAVSFVLSPLWSRAYPVDYFASAALLQSFSGLFAAWTTLAYHNAIHTPEDESEALHLALLSLIFLAAFSALVLIACAVGSSWILEQLGAEQSLEPWLLLAPVLVLLGGGAMIMDQWMARTGRLAAMAKCIAIQAVVAPAVPALGLMAPTATNFIILSVTSSMVLAAALRLRHSGLLQDLRRIRPRLAMLRAVAAKRRNFPRDVLPSNVLTQFSSQLPLLMLSRSFDTDTIGQFARASTLLILPITVLGGPITAVFSRSAGAAYRTSGNCRPELVRALGVLCLVMGPYYAILAYTAPDLYPWFYGEAWRESGVMSRSLALSYAAMAIVGPLSFVLFLGNNTRWDLLWQVLRVPTLLIALGVGVRSGSATHAVAVFSIANCALYGLYLALSFRLARRPPEAASQVAAATN